MKLVLLFLLTIIFPAEVKENFFEQVAEGYEIYREVIDYENQYYELSIIQGINDGNVTYGILFYNQKPATDPHSLVITINDKEYHLQTNSRNDIYAPAIKLNQDAEISVYDSFGKKRGSSYIVKAIEESEFRILYDDFIEGNNMGLELSKLSRNLPSLSLQLILILVFVGIIVITSLIIFFLFITKKGMFNEKKKIENVFNFREFAQSLYNQSQEENEFTLNDDEVEEVKEPIYQRQRDYDDEEENITFDIEKELQERGYRTDYKNLSEIEKNEVMLELMKMRDYKEITLEQYQQEVVKLWSK